MPVGNDIVDLREAGARPGGVHPRFDGRVFTGSERERIASAPAVERLRWTLWAAKESAFKAARQLDPGIRFIPRRFSVELLDHVRAEVTHELAGRFRLWMEQAQEWVHAVAVPAGQEGGRPESALGFVGTDADADPSPGRRVREMARRAVGEVLSVDPAELRIVSSGGIPAVMRRGAALLPVDLSLSHHGRVVACAWRGGG